MLYMFVGNFPLAEINIFNCQPSAMDSWSELILQTSHQSETSHQSDYKHRYLPNTKLILTSHLCLHPKPHLSHQRHAHTNGSSVIDSVISSSGGGSAGAAGAGEIRSNPARVQRPRRPIRAGAARHRAAPHSPVVTARLSSDSDAAHQPNTGDCNEAHEANTGKST